jgi:hypothetical protein
MEKAQTVTQQTKAASKNGHQIVMSYNSKVYHVDLVRVKFQKGQTTDNAIFHAREVTADAFNDLSLPIPHSLYDVLVEYAKLDAPDLILVLDVKEGKFRWNVVSDAWLKQAKNSEGAKQYIT